MCVYVCIYVCIILYVCSCTLLLFFLLCAAYCVINDDDNTTVHKCVILQAVSVREGRSEGPGITQVDMRERFMIFAMSSLYLQCYFRPLNWSSQQNVNGKVTLCWWCKSPRTGRSAVVIFKSEDEWPPNSPNVNTLNGKLCLNTAKRKNSNGLKKLVLQLIYGTSCHRSQSTRPQWHSQKDFECLLNLTLVVDISNMLLR